MLEDPCVVHKAFMATKSEKNGGRSTNMHEKTPKNRWTIVPPLNSAATPSTLSTKGDDNKNPQRKYYIITAEYTKYP